MTFKQILWIRKTKKNFLIISYYKSLFESSHISFLYISIHQPNPPIISLSNVLIFFRRKTIVIKGKFLLTFAFSSAYMRCLGIFLGACHKNKKKINYWNFEVKNKKLCEFWKLLWLKIKIKGIKTGKNLKLRTVF